MNRLIKICVFSAVVVAGSLFSAPKAAEAGYGYGYGYGYRPSYNYYAPTYYAPTYYAPSYSYGYSYGGFCY
jgi:hypothetical protein